MRPKLLGALIALFLAAALGVGIWLSSGPQSSGLSGTSNANSATGNGNQSQKLDQGGQRLTDGWHYYPRYSSVPASVTRNGVLWIATSGGVARISDNGRAISWITMREGLLSNAIWSLDLDPSNDILWIAAQGGDEGDYGIVGYDIRKGRVAATYTQPAEIENQQNVFSKSYPATYDGLISGANAKLHRDPYTGKLWVATFRGVAEYNPENDRWTSYASGAGRNFAGVSKVDFTPYNVWIRVTPNANTQGGVMSRARGESRWVLHSPLNGLDLDFNDVMIAAVGEEVWAAGRPYDWQSYDASRSYDVYRFRPSTNRWERQGFLDSSILQHDAIRSMDSSNAKLVLQVQREGEPTYALHIDPTSNTVEKGSFVDIAEPLKSFLPYPSSAQIQFAMADGTFLLEGNTLFDPVQGGFDSRIATAITDAAKSRSYRAMDCNRWNPSNGDVFLEPWNEYGGGDTDIRVYRSSTGTVEVVGTAAEWARATKDHTIVGCSGGAFQLLGETGMEEYVPGSDGSSRVGTGFTSFEGYLGRIGTSAYFISKEGKLGVLDLAARAFSYENFPEPTVLDTSGNKTTFDRLAFQTSIGNMLWFAPGDQRSYAENIPRAFAFDRSDGSWTTFNVPNFVPGERFTSIKSIGADTWLFSSRTTYVLRGGTNFGAPPESFTKAMFGLPKTAYDLGSSVWYQGYSGFWGEVSGS